MLRKVRRGPVSRGNGRVSWLGRAVSWLGVFLGRAGARLWRVLLLRGESALSVKVTRLAVVLVVLAAAVFGGGYGLRILERQSVTTTYSMKVGSMTRSWEQITPVAPLPKDAPIIVVLSGIAATVPEEIGRDRFMPYVNADMAELVYPVSYRESWNAIGCCGAASRHNVDDVAFIKALAARVDPGNQRQIDVVGYSNGGRLAYRMACDYPGVFDQIAVVKADPQPGCVVTRPQDVLQVASLNDTAVPFEPGDNGEESPPATVQVGRLRTAAMCPETSVTTAHGSGMKLTVWDDCADGTRIGFAVYSSGGHNFPPPTSTEPAAAAVIWAFFHATNTVKPLPA
jgi:polyhydroxybutyrate depolymerase